MRAARPAPLTLLATALASLVVVEVLFVLYVHPAYAQDGSEPAKPTGLTGTATHDQVVLTWDDPQDDSITGYVVLRRNRDTDAEGQFDELAADTGSAATTYTDDTVAASTAYTYRIRAINGHGVSEHSGLFHIDTSPAPEPVNSPATGEPTISGTAQVGETLTANTSGIADEDGLDDVSFIYQWLADDAEIAGATNATYTLGDADEGKAIKVRVSFTDDAGNAESLTSASTETVAETGKSPANPTGPDVGGPGDSEQGTVYTYEDGDRTIRVILQGDLGVQETGADTPSDGVGRRTARGNIVRKQSGQGTADLPVFRSASGGALMTLPGGVLLALDPDWDEAMVNGFFARNNISKTRISELDYIPNGFFVRTEPGFPSLDLANALAAQKGVLVSSPNWWREVGTRQDPGKTKGDDRGAAKEARRIEPRRTGFDDTYDLPLDGSYNATIEFSGDVDYFKLDLSGQTGATDVRIYTTGAFDTVGELYDSGRVFFMANDDRFGSTNFSLLASLSEGVYYVLVAGYAGTGSYTLHAETVTATSVSLGSSEDASIGAAGEVDYFKLDLSGQTGTTDAMLFTFGDDLPVLFEGNNWFFRNSDVLGQVKYSADELVNLPAGVHLFAVWNPLDDTGGDYTLRAVAVQDGGSTTAAATALSLDAPTAGKITSAIDADYFELDLNQAKSLVIHAYDWRSSEHLDVVVLDSNGAEVSVNLPEPYEGDGTRVLVLGNPALGRQYSLLVDTIEDDFEAGTYYVKITAPGASISSPVPYALYAYEDTGYTTWVDDCADATNDLGISTINAPLYACQWHLNSADSADMDINVESVWAEGITGEGVNVVVVDDTIDFSHADLRANITSSLNHDYGGRSNAYRPADHHGTNVAGVIAARDNTIGVRGVAPRATIYGYNLIGDDGANFTTVNEAHAIAHNRHVTAVSNNSYGFNPGIGFNHAPTVWKMAIESGVTQGYGGKGVFYVMAGGNGHLHQDNSNTDEDKNYYGITAVCAVGDDGARAEYSDQGANLWVCAPSRGGDRGIVTTENSDRYTNTFNGTSAAAPKVAGVAALLRHANPDLTWRDLKLILAASARRNDTTNSGWDQGARKYGSTDDSDRYHFNHEYGFGVVDAASAVALAQDWRNLPEFKNASSASGTLNRTIPDNTASGVRHAISVSSDMEFTEFVEVTVAIDHPFWRDLWIELVSPAGTVSTLAVPVVLIGTPVRPPDSTVSPATFRFGSAKHLGEDPSGTWTLRVSDELATDEGTLVSWSIKVYGHDNPVRAVSTGRTTATATVELQNPDSDSLTVHLRYSDDDGTTWSTPAMQTTTGTSVDFPLTGLAPNAEYVLEASLDSTFGERSGFTADFVNRPTNQDIDTLAAAGNTVPVGLWSDGTTIWVVNNGQGTSDDKIYAYTLATGARNSDKDIAAAASNTVPVGLWSDGTTIWVVNNGRGTDNKTYAYTLATGARNPDKDFDTLAAAGNINPFGLWSDSTTMWVANFGTTSSDAKIYAYTLATGVRNPDKDFDTVAAAGNDDPRGLWSDGTTIWVADSEDDKLYAYTLATGARDSDRDFDTLAAAGNTLPYGLWSDNTTIWVADSEDDKLYAYYIEVSTRTPVNTPPDLVVGAPTVDNSNPVAGASFTLRATVSNNGGSAAVATTLTYYRSTNVTIDTNDSSVGTDPVSGLAAAGTSAESIDLTAPSTAGTYYYGACVVTVTSESNTTNNCSTAVTVTVVGPPDLVVVTPTVSDSNPLTGASFTLRATVRNQGSSSSASTTLRYYRSTDATISASDTSVGTDTVSTLSAGASSDESITVTAPTTAGTYYYGACVVTVTNESDTANNCSTAVEVRVLQANAGPSFSSSATISVAENQTRVGTVVARDSDVGDDVTGYAITGGADQSFFSIGATSGALTFDAAPNYEDAKDQGNNNTYVVEVEATSGAGEREKTATQTITVTVTDVNTEAPGKPAAPTVSAASVSSLTVNWSAPDNAGPAITDYDVQYRAGTSGGWRTKSHSGTATATTLTGLLENTLCQVQVRASNAEGRGSWSTSGSGRTDANAAPAFNSSSTFSAAENQTPVGTVRATDIDNEDSIEGYAITGGADQAFFSIGATSGVLTFKTAPNYEDAQDQGRNNTYVVEVTATSGTGEREKTATQTITVRVTDVNTEAPGQPGAPSVTAASATSLSVNWSAPDNAGPAITDYDVQYRAGTSGGWRTKSHSGTATATTLTGLLENTLYQVQVRASNAEGRGSWSTSGSGRTDAEDVPAPDLVVGRPTASAGSLLAGESFTLSATVSNRGSAAASAIILTYYRSTNTTIDTNDTAVGTDAVSRLVAGADSDESISVTAPSTAGTYHYGACVDAVTNESDTTNNCSAAVTVTVGAAPARATRSFSPPSVAPAGEVVVMISASGYGSFGAVTETLPSGFSYVSSSLEDDSVTVNGREVRFRLLGETDFTYTVAAPDAAGTYSFSGVLRNSDREEVPVGGALTIAVADGDPLIVRYDDNKNGTIEKSEVIAAINDYLFGEGDDAISKAEVIRLINLYLFAPSTPHNPPGAPEGLTAAGNGQTRIDLSWSAPPSDGGAAITGYRIEVSGDRTIWNDLESDTGTTATTYSHTGLRAGTAWHYQVSAINSVGPGPVSNIATGTTDSSSNRAPDLVVDPPSVSDSTPDAGAAFTLTATVRNRGDGRSGFTTLHYYRSIDSTITAADTQVGTDDLVLYLNALDSSDKWTDLTAPETPGTYYYGACVDAVPDESDTTNNCSTAVTVSVGAAPAPDLVVETPAVDDGTPDAGAAITLSATVRNQGDGASAPTTLRYYRSIDSAITSADTPVGTDSVGGLDASGTSAETIRLTAPDTPGTYHYGACVDAVAGESDPGNNCSTAVTVAVGAAPAPACSPGSDPTPLHLAVENGDIEDVRALAVSCPEDLNAISDHYIYEQTPLSLAIANEDADITRILVDAGADPNKRVNPAFRVGTHLTYAVGLGYADIVQILLDADADPNVIDTEQYYDQTPLSLTIGADNEDMVRRLIAAGADPNKKVNPAFRVGTHLTYAVGLGYADIVQILLDADADPNVIDTEQYYDQTPLSLTIGADNEDMVRRLIAAGADPNKKVNPAFRVGTHLTYAVGLGYADIVQILLDADADPNVIDTEQYYEESPLSLAVKARNVDMVRILVAAGADPHLELDQFERVSPLDIAIAEGYTEIVAILTGSS